MNVEIREVSHMLDTINKMNKELANLDKEYNELQVIIKALYKKWKDNEGLLTGDFAKEECKYYIHQRNEVSRWRSDLSYRHDKLVNAYCAQGEYELALERGEI